MAKLTKAGRDRIATGKFAFPKQRKEPLENASHVRNAAARFNQVEGVTAAEKPIVPVGLTFWGLADAVVVVEARVEPVTVRAAGAEVMGR